MINNYLYYTFIYSIEAVIFYMYCYRLFEHTKWNIKDFVIIFSSYHLLAPISCIKLLWLNIIGFLCINILLFHFLKGVKISIAFFHAAILTALMAASELIVMNLIPNIQIKLYRESNTINDDGFLFLILNKIIYFLMSQMISNICRDKSVLRQPDKSTFFLSIASLLSTTIMFILIIVGLNVSVPDLFYNLISFCSLLLFSLTIIIFAMHNYYQTKANEYVNIQLQLQKEYDTAEYYKSIVSNDEQQHILIHDIKNHLSTISALNDKGDSAKITSYINSIMISDAFKNPRHLSDNDIMNIILSRYMNMCHEHNITFTTDIRSNTLNRFDDSDLTTLFCNLLDNSLTAAITARADYDNSLTKEFHDTEWEEFYVSYINLNIKHLENSTKTVIVLVNSCPTDPFSSDGKLYSTKRNKQFHGFGITSVRNIVKRYNGEMEQYYKEDTKEFHTVILM